MPRRRSASDVSDVSSQASSQGSKRRRLSDEDEEADDDGLLPDSFRRSPRANRIRHEDEKHQPGSLVRISMKNFVTYTKATFKCGPSLNMIIGPNGTGKSTLVCAICLGLGSKPTVLGRSKEIGEFVKHGHREAEIEVELAGREGQQNPIIHHTIKRDGNKSSWKINGRQTTGKEVANLVRSFSIQIDNLCQFLPQDRVVEFAGMSPVQLLESTQKAAAREEMNVWHGQLKSLGAERLKMHADNAEDAKELDNLERRHAQQQGEVNRIRERQALNIRLQGLVFAKPIMQYAVEREKHIQMKATKRKYQAELHSLNARVEPQLEFVREKERQSSQIKECVKEAAELVKKNVDRIDVLQKRAETKKQEVEEKENEAAAEIQSYNQRKPAINTLDQKIRSLKRQLEEEPVEVDIPAFNLRLREKDEAIRGIIRKAENLKAQEAEIKVKLLTAKNQHDKAKDDINDLQSAAGQQTARLAKLSQDSAKAYTWLQKNADMFREKIYGPPLLECKVKNPRYAAALESTLSRGDLVAFTATNRDDWKKFQDICHGSLGVKDVWARVATRPLSHWQPPVPTEQLTQYGLEGYAIDFLEGPDAVLSMLCDTNKLNRTAVSLNEVSDAQFESIKESQIQSWVAGRSSYRVNRRREYGPNAVSTVVSQVRPASVWNHAGGVDVDERNRLHAKLREVETEIADLEEEYAPIKDQLKDLNEQRDALDREREQIANEKADAQKAKAQWESIPRRIESLEDARASKQQLQDEASGKVDAIRDQKRVLINEQAQLAMDLVLLLERVMQMQEEQAEIEIQQIEIDSELDHLQEESKRVTDMLEQRRREIDEYTRQITRQTELCQGLIRKVRSDQDKIAAMENGEEIHLISTRWKDNEDLDTGEPLGEDTQRTLDDLEAEILATRGRLELLHEGNPRALQQFEERARLIEQMREKIANFETNLAMLNQAIAEIQGRWEPELDELVEQISSAFAHNFERIGCAGQVSVKKHDEDFRQWEIQIEVKFRENEELAVLDSHRQSGGERAVSTIFYLMALQSLARSPFRVVDEINQGMDPRNERMVHERMVDIACSENTSQYFLVTPKLLNDLKYHERMVVHTIFSGADVPENDGNDALDFAKLAERARQMGRVHC